ncbi:hypothetical protein N9Q16_01385 [Gammaproteobacteria bacterium]|jgi:hypothetical protein|nr:hypothetical protein [Gammaproteobacteria bacterium]
MDYLKHKESLIVFTHRSKELLLDLNGSLAWKIDPERVRKCKYIVCARNTNHGLADLDVPHSSAFLIGKVSGVSPALNLPRDNDRWMVKFDEYAELNIPNAWDGQRWPVKYYETETLLNTFDIDSESLDWKKVPDQDLSYIYKYFEDENEYLDRKEGKTSGRPPIHYVGIDPADPPYDHDPSCEDPLNNGAKPLTIPQAKAALSIQYDIPEENIEIILKG